MRRQPVLAGSVCRVSLIHAFGRIIYNCPLANIFKQVTLNRTRQQYHCSRQGTVHQSAIVCCHQPFFLDFLLSYHEFNSYSRPSIKHQWHI